MIFYIGCCTKIKYRGTCQMWVYLFVWVRKVSAVTIFVDCWLIKSKFPTDEFSIREVVHDETHYFTAALAYLGLFKALRQLNLKFLYILDQLVKCLLRISKIRVSHICKRVLFRLFRPFILTFQGQTHQPVAELHKICDFDFRGLSWMLIQREVGSTHRLMTSGFAKFVDVI